MTLINVLFYILTIDKTHAQMARELNVETPKSLVRRY